MGKDRYTERERGKRGLQRRAGGEGGRETWERTGM